ncbi:hypothetical protein FYJ85_17360 [Victivallaceae bacterium BBE-744-WT-12]|uniref:Carbohydrate-binding domain-containing protein n=1 Tax=Victivallis lenta TaxID=2606640 RepID=A0A844G4V7_9BACT|nr:hypothetical protein [Victivallis lenta]
MKTFFGTCVSLFILFAYGSEPSKVQIDRYGQFTHLNFPEKVTSDAQLKADIAADEAYYASFPLPERTFWGGLPGSREKYGLTATGFFHLEKVDKLGGRIVLVEPEGNLYFHIGMSVTQPGNEFTRFKGRENIYEWIPEAEGIFKPARTDVTVSFYLANYIRKFGSYDLAAWQRQMIERCRRWGFNSHGAFTSIFGNNADTGFAVTACLERYMKQAPFHLVSADFIDPFDPYNAGLLEKVFAQKMKKYIGKPELIGYYTENERFYSSVITDLLASEKSSPAKERFVSLMRDRYKNDIAAFNRNWQSSFASFDEVAAASLAANTPAANSDAAAFEEVFFDAFYKLLAGTLKKIDPDHLFLGERMLIGQTYNSAVIKAMGKYCDIFSINYYTDEFSHDEIKRLAELSGRPLLLSEWSYGSPEQGLFGVRNVENQEERGKAYSRYAENAAASPYVIGHQYFALLDESNTGRGWEDFNGERFNLGFVNVCDRPYKTFITHAAKSNNLTYDLIEGKATPPELSQAKAIRAEKYVLTVGKVKPGAKIDGNRAKYPGRPGEVLRRSVDGKTGNTADFICGWDENYLYILYTVPDTTPATNNHKRHVCLGDGIELFFGTDLTSTGRMQPGDRQLLVRATPGNDPGYLWCVNGATLHKAQVPLRLCRVSADGKSWSMELAVPWKELGIKPEAGVRLRFDTAVVLSTAQNDERGDKLVWNGLEENYCCRDFWGQMVLEN